MSNKNNYSLIIVTLITLFFCIVSIYLIIGVLN